MFRENSYLIDAQHLILPATTLVEGCYQGMFSDCELLTTAPELPATTLADRCYYGMFRSCSGLTTAPALPATTLASNCYSNMFVGCTSLTTAPELPATTLTNNCYYGMFQDCTSLNYIKCLATYISAYNCTYRWVADVASSGTFVKDSTMTSWTTGDNGIPTNWAVTYVGSTGLQWSSSTYDYTLNNVFTAPTLTNPNNLTVTYSSSNTSVATIDSSTGTITLQGTGTTTISAAFAGDDNYNAQTVTYTLTVSKANAGLSWSTDTKTQLLSETFDAPTLSNPNSLTVTYSSSDASVATINSSTGVVTINDAGNTTISATFAGNSVYNSQIVSYTLNVVASLTKDWGVDAVNEYTPDINRSYITDVSNLTADKMTVNYVKPDGTSGSFQSRFLRTSNSYGNPNQGISGFRTWINHYVSSYGNKISCWDDISSNTTILTTWANTTGVQVAYGWMSDLSTSGQNWGDKYTTKKIGAFKNCNLLGVIVMDGDLVKPEQYCNVSVKAWDGSQMTNDGRPCVSFDANTTINAKGALIAIVYTEN
jgi:hypothetical protein